MEIPLPGSDLVNPLTSQFGHLSLQDKAFLDAFNRQEQQELHGVPRPGPVDPTALLGQLEQVTTQYTEKRLHRQGSIASQASSGGGDGTSGPGPGGVMAGVIGGTSGAGASGGGTGAGGQRHHEVVAEIAAEEVRWFYKREVDKDWTPFQGYDSLRVELRYRHIWQTKWSDVDRRTNTMIDHHHSSGGPRYSRTGPNTPPPPGSTRGGRRTRSLSRGASLSGGGAYDPRLMGNGYDDEEYLEDEYSTHGYPRGGSGGGAGRYPNGRSGGRNTPHYRSAEYLDSNGGADDRDMRLVVRGGVYEVDLGEWKCHSLYWPGEAFDLLRGTWFHAENWQPVASEYADRIEQEHLQRFHGHKMADYVWDSSTSTRLEKQVHHTMSFPEFHVDWMSPEEVYMHRENASSQLYRGISASLGFKKPQGYRLFRGYKELCQHSDRLPDISHIVFVVHGVGQVVDDTTIIRNTNILRDNVSAILAKSFPNLQRDTGQRIEFFPVEWRSSLRLDEGMVKHITPQRIMGLRNLLNSSAMDIMYYTSPLFRMEIWQTLQEELNRLYEMFVSRNPYFEANGGKVSIVAHSLGCVVTYDILTGWTQDVEHSWYNLQTRGGGVQDLKRSRRFRPPGGPGSGPGGGLGAGSSQTGLLFRIENFFCLGSPLSVFLTLRWRDPTNQEYHDHILPRSLCKFLYNVYHPCDPVAYRVEPVFMKFYSKVEPVHLLGAAELGKVPYSELPLQPLQNARKDDDQSHSESSMLPVNIANGAINISVGKMILPAQAAASSLPKSVSAMSPSLSLPKMPSVLTSGATTSGGSTTSGSNTNPMSYVSQQLNGTAAGGAMNQVGAAAGGLLGGMFGMVKDAAAAVAPGGNEKEAATAATSAAARAGRPGMPPLLPSSRATASSSSHHPPFNRAFSLSSATTSAGTTTTTAAATSSSATASPSKSASRPPPSFTQEVKLPDGQRLAYRMDYVLREIGNTYIAAVTSHTSYWSNPDVAWFIMCKLHPELERGGSTKQQQPQPQKEMHPQAAPMQQQPQPHNTNTYHQQPQHQQYQTQYPHSHHQQMAHHSSHASLQLQQQHRGHYQQQQQQQQHLQSRMGPPNASSSHPGPGVSMRPTYQQQQQSASGYQPR